MKSKKLSKFALGLIIMVGTIGLSVNSTPFQANIGYYAAKSVGHGGGGQAFYTGVVGTMGAYGGAKLGASIGCVGGPVGSVIGAGLGAL